MISQEELLSSLALNDLAGLGPVRFRMLIDAFGSAAAAAQAVDDWPLVPGLESNDDMRADVAPALGRAEADAELARRHDVRILLAHDGPYPALLRTITNSPPVLYVWGTDICGEEKAVALVGNRRCSHYGEKMARTLARDLSDAGVVTVSGLARGIDTHAHRAAIEAGGKTWAVVGSGLLMTYPPENRGLASQIARSGAVISEFPMALKPHPSHFPRRNRVIAGISAATVVVEGTETSGALITARLAAEEGRDVFAVPGPATSPGSRAPHLLLKQGAGMVESANDILTGLGWPALAPIVSGGEAVMDPLVTALSDVPLSKEDLLAKSGLEPASAAARLLELELRGLIKSLPGGKLVRA